MGKFCTNCGKELDEKTSVCLNCGKLVNGSYVNNNGNKKKKGLPTWAIVLIVLGCVILIPIILIVILGIIGYNFIKENNIDINEYSEDILVQSGTIGDTLINDDFKITLDNALIYSSIEGENITDTPTEGKEYLVFLLSVENNDDESNYISIDNFYGYVDGYDVSVKHLFNDVENLEILDAKLMPGMKAKGYVAFEVDTNWKEFELHFSDIFDNGSEMIFKVINEEDNASGL